MPLTPPNKNESENRTLIDVLLAEQRDLTAVERFAGWHSSRNSSHHNSHYKNLLPLTPPEAGEQYAFEVDLDKCSGCKACVTACHSLNGLDDCETWRGVGLLVSDSRLPEKPAFQQHVTTACHHCADPGCLNGCPVLAYDKDPVTGIVRHLDDQCIGCQYCVMKCPYEVPKYSSRLGIVRKCDMCSNRLAVGEAPACVQACPSEAIRITLVDRTRATNSFLPDSPDLSITRPTTRYISQRALPKGLLAADHNDLRLDHAHWPLIVMLVLTQAAAGLFVVNAIVDQMQLAIIGFTLLTLGIVAAVFHLGQPMKAWRGFMGWRTSWLSRELIGFHIFAGVAVMAMLPAIRGRFTITSAAVLGLAAVFTSGMVYVDTKRPFWCGRITFGNFFGTALLLGSVFAAMIFAWLGKFSLAQTFAVAGLIIRAALFVWRRLEVRTAFKNPQSPIHFNARVIRKLLSWTITWRSSLFIASTGCGIMAIADIAQRATIWASIVALTASASEIIGRYVFFTASASKRMPGGVAA